MLERLYNFLLLNKNFSINLLKMYIIIIIPELLLLDDEPLWEPLEWTFTQSFCLYFFLFSWIAETLVTSRYGSFTGRDKRVYMGLYRSLWYMEIYFMFNLFVTALFIIVPFYYEVTYPISYIVSWWDFIDFTFFYKVLMLFCITNHIFNTLKISNRWNSFEFLYFLSFWITIFIFYLFFTHSIQFFFAFFTDINWFKKSGWLDFQSLSNGLAKWGWGSETRDHFSYHKTSTVFWYKNDATFASAFFIINFFLFISLIFLFLQWLMVVRSLSSNKEISYTLLTYAVSSLNQFFFCYLFIYFFVITSIVYQFSRIAVDSTWELFIYELIEYIIKDLINLFS